MTDPAAGESLDATENFISFAPQVYPLDTALPTASVGTPVEPVADAVACAPEVTEPVACAPVPARADRRTRLRAAHLEAVARSAAGVPNQSANDTERFVTALREELARAETRNGTAPDVLPEAAQRRSLVRSLFGGRVLGR